MPKISIIIPVYNAEKFISKCLDSLINQTVKNIEIICVNDGSKDNSLGVLKEYAKKDARIKIIDQANKGICGARNTGLRNAIGEYITFMDHEDYLHPQVLEIMLNQNSDVVAIKFQPIAPDETPCFEKITHLPQVITYKNPLYTYLAKEENSGNLTVWAKLYKKNVVENIWFNENLSIDEDCLFNFYALKKAKEMVLIPLALHYFVNTPTSVSRSKPSLRIVNSYLTAIDVYYNEIKGLNNQFAKDIKKNRIYQCLKNALKKMEQCPDKEGVANTTVLKIRDLYKKGMISYKWLSLAKKWQLFKIICSGSIK